MQASYASGCALGSPHRILGTQKSMRTIQYGFACLMRTFSKATEARSAVVAGQTEGRMSGQAHAAPLLYVHPHPTAARRAATLASSEREMRKGARTSLRPLQRRFKARKKPEGYTRDAIRRPPTYTQAQTHSCRRRVRRFLFWWRRGESNSGPRKPPDWHLQAQSLVLSRTLCAQRHARGVPTGSVLARAIPITCAGAFP